MTLTSTPPGIPDAPRLAGWIGESLGGEPGEGLVVPTLVARAHQVLDADD
jgi:hypothetical protein